MQPRKRVASRSLFVGVFLAALLMGAAAVEVNPPLPTAKVLLADRVSVTAELARSNLEKGRGLSGRPGLAS